jgi:RHS repeat-associated protein
VNDPATGLVYMQQRYYDPAVGRFISPDPVVPAPGSIFSFGRYTYAHDNPIVNTDPDGRDAVLITGPNGYKTLVIPIHLVGSGASSTLAQRLGNASSAAHSPSGVTVRYVVTAKPIHGVLNTMTVNKGGNQSVCGSGGTCTNAVGGNQSYVDSTRSDLLGAVMHEGLHMAGLTDKYSTTKISTSSKTSEDASSDTGSNTMIITDPGYSNNIMALDWIHNVHKDQLINEAEHNRTTTKCTKSTDGNVSC